MVKGYGVQGQGHNSFQGHYQKDCADTDFWRRACSNRTQSQNFIPLSHMQFLPAGLVKSWWKLDLFLLVASMHEGFEHPTWKTRNSLRTQSWHGLHGQQRLRLIFDVMVKLNRLSMKYALYSFSVSADLVKWLYIAAKMASYLAMRFATDCQAWELLSDFIRMSSISESVQRMRPFDLFFRLAL